VRGVDVCSGVHAAGVVLVFVDVGMRYSHFEDREDDD
jgi:hypothetical protein